MNYFLIFLLSTFILGLLWKKLSARARSVLVVGLAVAVMAMYFVFRKL